MKNITIVALVAMVVLTPLVAAGWDNRYEDEMWEKKWQYKQADINSIVDVAVAANSEGEYAGAFDTLIAAVSNTPLLYLLDNQWGRYTVFAPTDEAFETLGFNETTITQVPVAQLTDILMYHVARGERNAASVVGAEKIRMINRQFVEQDSGVLTDNNGGKATIIITDIPADNGMIHVIDAVLMP